MRGCASCGVYEPHTRCLGRPIYREEWDRKGKDYRARWSSGGDGVRDGQRTMLAYDGEKGCTYLEMVRLVYPCGSHLSLNHACTHASPEAARACHERSEREANAVADSNANGAAEREAHL